MVMRRKAGSLGVAAVLAGAGLVASSHPAHAAGTPSSLVLPPPPNVLILMDTSGSMTRTTGGNIPQCNPGHDSTDTAQFPLLPGDTVNVDRWGQIIQGMTGTVTPFYSCSNEARDGTLPRFKREYRIARKITAGSAVRPSVQPPALRRRVARPAIRVRREPGATPRRRGGVRRRPGRPRR